MKDITNKFEFDLEEFLNAKDIKIGGLEFLEAPVYYVKRSDKELKSKSDKFAYRLIKTFKIYNYANYREVNKPSRYTLKNCNEIPTYPSPLNGKYIAIDIPLGWEKLVWVLSKKLTLLNDNLRVLQVKEKFGKLRFYSARSNEQQDNLIDEYSELSGYICGSCGAYEKEGTLWSTNRDMDWIDGTIDFFYIYNFCNRCLEKANKKFHFKEMTRAVSYVENP